SMDAVSGREEGREGVPQGTPSGVLSDGLAHLGALDGALQEGIQGALAPTLLGGGGRLCVRDGGRLGFPSWTLVGTPEGPRLLECAVGTGDAHPVLTGALHRDPGRDGERGVRRRGVVTSLVTDDETGHLLALVDALGGLGGHDGWSLSFRSVPSDLVKP